MQLDRGSVDFDFGDSGEIGGFDLWRLTKFARGRFPHFGFDSSEQIEQLFDAAVADGTLESSRGGLHYMAGVPRIHAIDIDSTQPGDALPSKNRDIVITLYAHYFQAADLMRESLDRLDAKLEKSGKLSRDDEVQNRIYFLTWLGFLWATCEGLIKK